MQQRPFVALAPLITLIVGRDIRSGIVIVCVSAVFPILLGLLRGLSDTPAEMVELFRVHGASRAEILLRLRLRMALPHFFAGLRSALPTAFLAVLIAEWLTGSKGLGFLILDAAATMQSELLWGIVTLATTLSLILFCTVSSLERVFARSTQIQRKKST